MIKEMEEPRNSEKIDHFANTSTEDNVKQRLIRKTFTTGYAGVCDTVSSLRARIDSASVMV
jgi:hypothetical protein